MTALTVTAKGQVTLRKNVLEHLGVQPGDKIEVDLLPHGCAELHAHPKRTGSIEDSFGALYRPGTKALTIEEINEARCPTKRSGKRDSITPRPSPARVP